MFSNSKSSEEILKIEKEAYATAYKEIFKSLAITQIKLKDPQIPEYVLTAHRMLEENKKLLSQRDDTKYWAWITINPPPDIQKNLPLYEKCIQKSFDKKWIQDATAVIEQRGKTESDLGKGAHIHLRVRRDGKRPDHLLRELYNSFKPLLTQVPNEDQKKKLKKGEFDHNTNPYFYCKWKPYKYPDSDRTVEEELDDYCDGIKDESVDNEEDLQDKKDKVKLDPLFREKNNLKEIYKKFKN